MIKKTVLIFFLILTTLAAQNQGLLQSKFVLARNYESAGKLDKAEKIYSELFKIQPNNRKYLTALNNIYLKLKKYGSSISLLKKEINRKPNDIDLYGLLGTTYYISGDYKNAFAAWDKALEKSGSSPVAFRVIANYAIQNRAFDKAIEILKKGERKFNGSSLFVYDLANLYSLTMNYAKATEEYCSILKRQPSQLDFVKNRISIYIRNKTAFEPSEKIIKSFYEETSLPEFLDLLSAVYFQTGHFERAFETVKKLDDLTNAKGSKIFELARRLVNEEKYSVAVKAFEYLIKEYSSSSFMPAVMLNYAKCKEEILTSEFKNEDWKPVVNYKPKDAKGFDKVISAYLVAAKDYNNLIVKTEAYFRIGKIFEKYLKDETEALKYFGLIVKKFPFSSFAQPAKIEIAKIKICKGNLIEAEKLLTDVINDRSSSTKIKEEARYVFAKLHYWQGNFEKALSSVSKVIGNLSGDRANDALELRLVITILRKDSLSLLQFAKADKMIFCGHYEGAKTTLLQLYKTSGNFVLKNFCGYDLAVVSLASGDVPSAIAFLDSVTKNKELSLFADKAVFLSGEIYEYEIKNYAEAIKRYEKILESFPNSLYLNKSREKINSLKKELSFKGK